MRLASNRNVWSALGHTLNASSSSPRLMRAWFTVIIMLCSPYYRLPEDFGSEMMLAIEVRPDSRKSALTG